MSALIRQWSSFYRSRTGKAYEKYGVKWKIVWPYDPMSNVRSERMIQNIRKAAGKMVLRKLSWWSLAAPEMLYRYRCCALASGFFPYELLYGLTLGMPLEYSVGSHKKRSMSSYRVPKTLASASFCTTHPHKVNSRVYCGLTLQKLSVGDYVLVAHKRTLVSGMNWPAFTSKFYGRYLIAKAVSRRY